jgi:2',3'-cyclic-nucleotide 2'-phosphodiesterase (5'-nucleotidase family)
MKPIFLILFIALSSCSFKKSQLENQTQSGHAELYSQPDSPKDTDHKEFRRVIIAATNDIHGHYESSEIFFKDSHQKESQSVRVGGVDFISSYFKILRQQYGQVLLLDSGDLFSAKTKEMNFISDFYSTLGYDAITVGLNDFNLKLPSRYHSSSDFFKDFAVKSKVPLILSNLYDLKTARVVEWPGTLPYLIREVNGVKVGILGLIPDDIIEFTPLDNRVGFYFEGMLKSTLRHSRLLRSLGAEIIVALTHQGLKCGEEIAQELKLPLSKVNFEPERKGICDLSGQMGDYLNRLPPGLVDVVIGGRTHQKTANIINTNLVLSGFEDGKSFSYAELFVDVKSKKVNRDKTIVHQPVSFCQEFFKETNDCYTEDSTVDHKARMPAFFLGEKVEPDASVQQKFHSFLKGNSNQSFSVPKNIQSIIDFYSGDISYINSDSGNTKLILMTLKGSEVLEILEEEYNLGQAANWKPSPFKLTQTGLEISIQGSPIEAGKDYKVLTDIEVAQKHPSLRKMISRSGNVTLNNVSWGEPEMMKDGVSTSMSASQAVR